ncbi:hypothetical protein [Flavobacterium cellulosilyticum]|uniref:Uncharacterized protein n=1 Tax=Flavobacterium cellulosilyticum TaxID=2541731 RepID=A0A4R5C761_9FLAO|nr:hypothetical protein [Flavobacterium cellulosilyticum]TDD95558.1 hypothetical protein E0F76_13930 [Flavobacterium cellulosilyticum]
MKKILLTTGIVLTTAFTFGQGCSDAGICSIGHGFQSTDKELKNTIEVASIFGAGESDVTYFSPYVSYSRKINDKIALSVKVTFSSANGDFGTRAAFGDAFLIGNYSFAANNNKQWSALLGWKLPFTSSNLKINEHSLPLIYQSSLGTFDLFLGTNYKYNKLDFNVAVQIPVFNNNKNSYFKEYAGTNDFPSTNLFERKPDALFRATYTVNTKNQKFTFKPNVLFIYHLGEDSFENIYGKRENIIGSDGLTINGNLISTYKLSKQKSIELSIAAPFVIRDIRPDGLTRSFVLGLQYNYSF